VFWFPFRVKGKYTLDTAEIYRSIITLKSHFIFEKICLDKPTIIDLAEFGDTLSLFMMIDKLKTAEAFSELGNLPKEYIERMEKMNVPPHLKELLVKVITVLLRKINVPQDEIDVLVERIDERGISEMLSIENYNVQEIRREATAEAEQRIKAMTKAMFEKGSTVAEIASIMNVTEDYVTKLLPELVPA